MAKEKKRLGVAKSYPQITDELDMTHAKVKFGGGSIVYQKKSDDGKLTGAVLTKSYPAHALKIIHTRLKNGDEVYLLYLMQRIEWEKNAEKIRSLR